MKMADGLKNTLLEQRWSSRLHRQNKLNQAGAPIISWLFFTTPAPRISGRLTARAVNI
jgi:hypothetical protein